MEEKRQATNITESGEVLYPDAERLERKVVGFPPYKNKSNGLGIYNWLKEHVIYMSDKRWPLAKKLYKMFIRFSIWMKKGGIRGKIYKKGIMLYPDMETHTSTVVMPLNVDVTGSEQATIAPISGVTNSEQATMPLNIDLSGEGEKVIVPLDVIRQSLKNVTFIGGMDTCLCRESNDCSDYPHDLGCLFLGEAGRVIVKHGLGRQLTYEEALERVDHAAREGLMAQAVWVEVEQLLWGIRNDQLDKFLEICFCCPCCCIAMRLSRNATDAERHRFHPAGWTAVPDRTACIGCRKCVDTPHGCPVEAISFGEDGKVVINQEKCVGCGICKNHCPMDVIKIKQTMPMRSDLHEYFLKDYNIDLKLWEGQDE